MDPPNYLHLKFLQMEKLENYQISFKDTYPVHILVLSKLFMYNVLDWYQIYYILFMMI